MSSDSTDVREVPHYAYLVPFPTEIIVLCHHVEENDIFLLGGRVGPSPLTKMNRVETFLMETLVLQIGFRLPVDAFIKMYLYWEQTVSEIYFEIKYSLYVANVVFRDVINNFKNIGGAQTVIAKINFQEELFNLEQSGLALPNRTRRFETPPMVFCRYTGREISIYDYGNREPKTACVNYGLLTHIFEIKNNVGIDTGIVQKIAGFHKQKYDDQHKLWAHALAIYGSSAFAVNLKTSRSRPNVPWLFATPALTVSAYVQKLPNVTGDNISELDAH